MAKGMVWVYNLLGHPLTSKKPVSDNASISAPSGFAIVAIEGKDSVKVLVK